MMLFRRFLLLVAALAYGVMPMSGTSSGLSAMAMPVASVSDGVVPEHHGGSGMMREIAAIAADSADCPHSGMSATLSELDPDNHADHGKGKGSAVWHCSACLTLPVDITFAYQGPAARAAEAATLPRPLVSQRAAPLTPPPRA
jgi:hypothetical protein